MALPQPFLKEMITNNFSLFLGLSVEPRTRYFREPEIKRVKKMENKK